MILLSQIIDINSTIQPQVYMDASIPYFNSVYIIHGDTLEVGLSGIYYGDEIDLLFWEQLNISMSSGSVYGYTYTLIPDYRYIYFVVDRRFVIYDTSNNIVFENTIAGLNDFCIDFEVYKSHQFEVHVSAFGDAFSFYKIARWHKVLCESTFNYNSIGINNEVEPDRIRPYTKDDIDNPAWHIKYMSNIAGEYMVYSYEFKYIDIIGDIIGIILSNINNDNVFINNNFYSDLRDLSVTGELIDYSISAKNLSLDVVLPKLSKSIYPALMGTNFVLYEPWLIWGIYGILYSKRIVDIEGDDFEVFPFDLSPWWG